MLIDIAHLNRTSLESWVILKHKVILRLKSFRIAAFWIKEEISWSLEWILSTGPNENLVREGFTGDLGPGRHHSASQCPCSHLAEEGDCPEQLQASFSPQILWFQITVAFKDAIVAAWAAWSNAGSFQRVVFAGLGVEKTVSGGCNLLMLAR